MAQVTALDQTIPDTSRLYTHKYTAHSRWYTVCSTRYRGGADCVGPTPAADLTSIGGAPVGGIPGSGRVTGGSQVRYALVAYKVNGEDR